MLYEVITDVECKDDPEDDDHDVERPLQLMIFLGGVEPEQQCDRGGDDRRVKQPELERRQAVAPDRGLAQSLDHVIEEGEEAPDP